MIIARNATKNEPKLLPARVDRAARRRRLAAVSAARGRQRACYDAARKQPKGQAYQ
jgi:hypothetical protein